MYDLITSAMLAEGPEMTSTYVASVVITGIVVVFLALILLIALFSLLGYTMNISKKSDKKEKAAPKPAPAPKPVAVVTKPAAAPIVEDGIDEEVVAVIMAAICAMSEQSGKKLRLHSVKSAGTARPACATAGLIDYTRPF